MSRGNSVQEILPGENEFVGEVKELAIEFKEDAEKENPETVVNSMSWRRGANSVPRGTIYTAFASWTSRKYYGDWFDYVEGNWSDLARDAIEELYENHDGFRSTMNRNITVVDERHKKVGPLSEVGKQGGLTQDKDMEDEYETLYGAGVVDEDGNVNKSKLRGLVFRFAEEADKVDGESEAVNVDDLKTRFDEWMLRRIGGEWSKFTTQIVETSTVKTAVKYMWNTDEEFQSLIAEKWYDISDEQDELSEREKRQKKQNLSGYNDNRISGSDSSDGNSDSSSDTQERDRRGSERVNIDSNTVLNGDSTELIDDLIESDVEIDAVITDPPYGQSYDSRGDDHSVIEGDDNLKKALGMTEEVLKKCRTTMSSGSPIVCFAGDTSLAGVMEMIDRWYKLKPVCIWDKDWVTTSSMADTPMAWRKSHEYAVIGAYKSPRVENENRHDGTVWKQKRLSGDKMEHPTQKPVELMKYVIESLTEEGDVVFDPFAGSGSTLVAAKQLDRGYIGIEYDEEHYETIESRLSQDTLAGWA